MQERATGHLRCCSELACLPARAPADTRTYMRRASLTVTIACEGAACGGGHNCRQDPHNKVPCHQRFRWILWFTLGCVAVVQLMADGVIAGGMIPKVVPHAPGVRWCFAETQAEVFSGHTAGGGGRDCRRHDPQGGVLRAVPGAGRRRHPHHRRPSGARTAFR